MATEQQIAFLTEMKAAAMAAGHKWPGAAAAEAADETGWGVHIPRGSFNVLGIKAFAGWLGPVVDASGTEQSANGAWSGPQADRWCMFNSYEACFAEQMRILGEPRYALAMTAATAEVYIAAESHIWSTGILKGQAVLQIWRAHQDVLA